MLDLDTLHKGQFVAEFTISCAWCDHKYQYSEHYEIWTHLDSYRSIANLLYSFREEGWRYIVRTGWVCPNHPPKKLKMRPLISDALEGAENETFDF